MTAYSSGGNLVIVALNTGTGSVNQQFVIQNGNAATVEGYRTSSSQSMADIGGFGVSGGSFTGNLPGQSVTTFVQTSSGGGGPVPNGTYKIIARTSGLAMDAYGAQTGNGTQIDQWAYNGGNNQRWTITSLGGNIYKIIGVQSGRSLDIYGGNTGNGTKVELWDYNGGNNQRFALTATDSGNYRITPQNATGSCLDVTGNSTANGALVDLWTWNGGYNQQWSFQAP